MSIARRSLLAVLAASVKAADWPSFRGLHASGIADGFSLPSECDVASGKNILWRTKIAGLGHSGPVVGGGRVYLTAAISDTFTGAFEPAESVTLAKDQVPHRWIVSAVDAASGAILWSQTAHRATPAIARHVKSTHSNASPATNNRFVAAFFGPEGLHVYDTGGRRVWSKNLGALDVQFGWSSSPVIHKGSVIVQCDHAGADFVAAFDIASGNELWRHTREEGSAWTTPLIVDTGSGGQVITVSPGGARALDASNGKLLWHFPYRSSYNAPSPIGANGRVYVVAGEPVGSTIYALQSEGKVAWRLDRGGPYVPTPIVCGDLFFMVTDAGILGCYDAATGKAHYRERLGVGVRITASPVAGDGKLYLADEDGTVHVIGATARFQVVGTMKFPEPIYATPAIANGILYVRTIEHLYAVASSRPT